ncbi:MAG: 2-oxoacid:acceptor oxidoreductase family protein [Fervidicoccaceae archaeon]
MSNINNEEMIEITWLGRGGQGAVTAAELLAIAAIGEGKAAVAIPEFGAERRGAPVRAYNRLSSSMKELPKTPIVSPNILVVIDPSLVTKAEQYVNFERLRYVVSNTSMSREDLNRFYGGRLSNKEIFTVDASKIALEIFGRPIYNTIMLGALVGSIPLVKIENLENVIKKNFSGKLVELNMKAVSSGINMVKRTVSAGGGI